LHQISQNLEPRDLLPLYEELGRLMASLHSIDVGSKFGELSKFASDTISLTAEFSSNYDFVKELFKNSLNTFQSLNGSNATAEMINKFLSQNEHLLFSCKVPSLCHNDFHEVAKSLDSP
jgi:aminoglycoside phosphotransferase (APT) family kinase protein